MNKDQRIKLSNTLVYGIVGAFFGLLFPIIATLFDILYIQHLSFTLENIFLVQKQQPLHWIIDTAPLFLGLFAAMAGKKQDSLVEANEGLESKVRERTKSLEEKNDLLLIEIEERKKVEDKLVISTQEAIEARMAEENFLANMSHEIRTPMNGVVGFTELLSQMSLSAEQKEYVDAIRHSSSHLLAIINDILDISKIKGGHIEFEEADISIRDLIRNIENTIKVSAAAKNIQVSTLVDPEVPTNVIGDSVRLSQILLNLATNAIKFTDEGYVRISVHCLGVSENQYAISFKVKDTGIGIAPQQLKNIFKEFKQAESSTTRVYGGTGLGLSISKKLVELQGGQISVESTLNEGSTFSFNILFKRNSVRPKILRIPEENGESIPEGCKIMVVDDSRMNRVLVKKILQKGADNIFTEEVENGQEAIELLLESDFDLILLDLQMPVMNGFETCHQIRTKFPEEKRNVPIIALTADALPQEKIKAFDIGMNEYVIKPFKKEDLFQKINRLIRK
ncbi:MAG: response regulator [Saprospiraceae bacterium]|nr:response regulator [Saprospiraceae bacterium]